MPTGLVIFSRHDSTRLPGKALIPIAGKPLLGWVIDRSRQIDNSLLLVVATSDRPVDDRIAEYAVSRGLDVFRGDCADVRDRALACCEQYGFDRFARICGDSPFLDPNIWSRAVQIHQKDKYDLVTNTFPRTYPVGLSVEVIKVTALIRSLVISDEPEDREHIVRIFYSKPALFSIKNLSSDAVDLSSVRLAVDTEADLTKARWLAETYKETIDFMDYRQLIKATDSWEGGFSGTNI